MFACAPCRASSTSASRWQRGPVPVLPHFVRILDTLGEPPGQVGEGVPVRRTQVGALARVIVMVRALDLTVRYAVQVATSDA